MDLSKKLCIKCNELKDKDEFYKNKLCKDGTKNVCKNCRLDQMKKKKDKNYKLCEICKLYKLKDEFDNIEYEFLTQKCSTCNNKNYSGVLGTIILAT